MRTDIWTEYNGQKCLDIYKVIGKGYENVWFTNCYCRYRMLVGARSTKKSKIFLGYEPILKLLSDDRRNIVICRQNDVDNRGSTYENLIGCIFDLGLENEFEWRKQPLEIERKNTGQKIIFRGLNNPTSLNSITFAHGYWTDLIIEECFEVESFEDFRKVDGSVRGKLPKGLFFQITCCMNSWSSEHWIYQEFFKGRLEDDFDYLDRPDVTHMEFIDEEFIGPYGIGLALHKSTYKINEFRDIEVYDKVMNEMKNKSKEIYSVEALGMWGNATASVYPEFNDSCCVSIQDALNYDIIDFRIGIDTGLSDGGGHKIKINKNDDVTKRVRSATAMTLCGITANYQKMVIFDEYFHSNDPAYNTVNTDNRENLTIIQMGDVIVKKVIEWVRFYGQDNSRRGNNLLKGKITVVCDVDIGFQQVLRAKFQEYGIYNVEVVTAGQKLPIQSRVDFARLMMAYGDYLIVKEKCPNLVREIKNARIGDKGEGRQDGDDHSLTSSEYAFQPMQFQLQRWKNFKVH